jgi:hypothetical protein
LKTLVLRSFQIFQVFNVIVDYIEKK